MGNPFEFLFETPNLLYNFFVTFSPVFQIKGLVCFQQLRFKPLLKFVLYAS